MIRRTFFTLALLGALAVPMQSQAQVSSTFTVSGSSGSWFLDFAFTNLEGGGAYAYAFWVTSGPTFTFTGAPTGWVLGAGDDWWRVDPYDYTSVFANGIEQGETLGGFTGTSSSVVAPDEFTFSGWYGYAGDTSELIDPFVARVPEPGSMMLIAGGLFGLVGVARRRRKDIIDTA